MGYNTSHSFSASNNRVTTTGFSGVYPERSRRDTSGNQTNTNAGVTFAYNQENLLTTAGASVSYAGVYPERSRGDAQNRRKSKTVSGATTEYFYLGGAVIGERRGAEWRDYIYFAGQRVAWIVNSTTGALMHTDHLGSVRVCTLSGNVLGTCEGVYPEPVPSAAEGRSRREPFGETQAGSSCSLPTNYRFAGMEFDPETGLYHTWFRQYD